MDRNLYADLRIRAGLGEDVTESAQRAFENGLLKEANFNALLGEVERAREATTIPSGYRRGREYILNMLSVSPAGDSALQGFQKQALGRSLDEWNDWYNAHPDATIEQQQKMYRQLAEDGLNLPQTELSFPQPHYLVGGIFKPDLQTTYMLTKNAFERGEIDRFEFQRQAALIADWKRTQDRRSPPAEGK